MQTKFVAVFPGSFLYITDSLEILKHFRDENSDKYLIEIKNSSSVSYQDFIFSFTDSFIEEAFKGYKKKGEEEYNRAMSIKTIFKQKYEAKLMNVGALLVRIEIPDNWDEHKKKLAEKELSFQFYHVSKKLLQSIQAINRLRFLEFKKFYTYLGNDGFEGLSRKITTALKLQLMESIPQLRKLLQSFKNQIGSIRLFPISILGWRKSQSFKTLMTYRLDWISNYRFVIESELIALLARISVIEPELNKPLNLAKEALNLYKTLDNGLNEVKDMFSFQLGITSTFFEVIGLTLALPSLIYSLSPEFISSSVVTGILILIFLSELLSLLFYSTGPSLKKQLDMLIEQTNIYQI